ATVTDGLRKHRSLRISYERPGATDQTARNFDPYHIVRYHGEWYLIGHCYLRDALRTFAVSRIRCVDLLDTVFVVPDDFNSEAYSAGGFGIFASGEEYMVRIHFHRDLAPYVLERQWHPDQKIVKDSDGGIELNFPAADLHGVQQWVLSWGGGAKVQAPDLLVANVKSELQKALGSYE
ncbi:MAG: WYL domain-containing protein, partial [Desulfobulbaceae bacterium]|nr:WYL domain-containing protein [Desulfobulbaceae bacterium]